MSFFRFLVDENTSPSLADQLRRLKPEMIVRKIGDADAPSKGTPDAEILVWLEDHGFCLITQNRKSMPKHLRDHLATGRHVPGILTIRPNISMRMIIDDILLIWEAAEKAEYQDQIAHIPL